MKSQRIAVALAVALALVLATGMTIAPKQAPTLEEVKPATTPAASAEPAPLLPAMSFEEFQVYIQAVVKAEALPDPLQRCLAYPPLAGNDWPKAMVEGLCALVPPEGSLDALDAVLKQPGGGAELDRRYAALLAANYADPKQKDRIFRAYDIFDESAHAAAVAKEWVRQSPDSAYARTARAWQLVDSGWDARGAKFMRETPGDNVKRMEQFFAQAVPDLDFALKQNPKLLPACDRLISIGATSSATLQEIGGNLCIKADPASYRVMSELLWANQPKWGGTQEQMRALVAVARAHEADNPTLAALRGFQAGYEAAEDTTPNHFGRTAPILERVSMLSPGRLEDASRALINLDRSFDAYAYASQAIRFNPRDKDAYYDRANALRKLNAYELAIKDAERSKELGNKDGWPEIEIAVSLQGLARYKEVPEHATAAMADPDTSSWANETLCRNYWYTHELAKMAECTEKLVADYPGNDEAWRLRAVAYKDAGDPKAYDAVSDFLQRADPKRQANEITWFKGWQVEHPRAASVAVPAAASAH